MKKLLIILLFISDVVFAQLSVSNLKLSVIIDTLNDVSANSLSEVCLSSNVNKYGLNAVYCPGDNANERLSNLQTDQKQSYFKGYKHTPYACNLILAAGGYSVDTVLYQVKLNETEGVFKFNYQSFTVKDYFDLYDGTEIIDETFNPVSGGSLDAGAEFTSDGEYNYPLWYYHDGVAEDTIYIRTYTPFTGTVWSFRGYCPSAAVIGTTYSQEDGVTLFYSGVNTPNWQLNSTSSDSVYFKAYADSGGNINTTTITTQIDFARYYNFSSPATCSIISPMVTSTSTITNRRHTIIKINVK